MSQAAQEVTCFSNDLDSAFGFASAQGQPRSIHNHSVGLGTSDQFSCWHNPRQFMQPWCPFGGDQLGQLSKPIPEEAPVIIPRDPVFEGHHGFHFGQI